LGDPDIPTGPAQFGVIQAIAPSLRVEVSAFNKRDAGEIERAITAFARVPNGGLIVTAGGPSLINRDLVVTLAAQHKLPAVYYDRAFVAAGGLLSYAPDRIDMYRARPATLTVFSRARSQLICRCRRRRNISLSLTSRQPKRWVSTCRCISSSSLTR